jgi:hypothetical protein
LAPLLEFSTEGAGDEAEAEVMGYFPLLWVRGKALGYGIIINLL